MCATGFPPNRAGACATSFGLFFNSVSRRSAVRRRHIGYFRRAFVERRAWLDADAFATIVAFCSVLPGPTSSQVGMLIGFSRAGAGGALAALVRLYRAIGDRDDGGCACTRATRRQRRHRPCPLVSPASWRDSRRPRPRSSRKRLLVLARTLCPDVPTRAIAIVAAAIALIAGSRGLAPFASLAIAAGAVGGALFADTPGATVPAVTLPIRVSSAAARWSGALCIAVIALICIPSSALAPAGRVAGDDRGAPVRSCSAAATWCCRCSKA